MAATQLPMYPVHIAGPKKSRRPLYLTALAVVVIILVVVGVWFYLRETKNTAQQPVSLLISIGQSSIGPLYTIPLVSSSTPKIYQPSFAISHIVLDYAGDATTSYYIFENGNQAVSNIYSESVKNSKVPPALVTDTASEKADLSYDASAHALVFASSTATNPHTSSIILLNTVTGTEQNIGEGTDPVLLPGGIMVLIRVGNALEVINSINGTEASLVSLDSQSPFAVTSDGNTLALYNPTTHAIDYFDISNVTSASYQRSSPAPLVPTAMAFKGNQLYLAGTVASSSSEYALQIEGSAKPLATFSLAEGTGIPLRILFP